MMQELPLTYQELDLILRGVGDEDLVGISAVDGLIAAVVAGPAFIERDEWLQPIIGDRGIAAAASGGQTKLFVQSIVRRHDDVADVLAHRPESYLPIFMHDEGKIIAEDWTVGFMMGVGLRAKVWEKIMLSPFRSKLAPILTRCAPWTQLRVSCAAKLRSSGKLDLPRLAGLPRTKPYFESATISGSCPQALARSGDSKADGVWGVSLWTWRE